MAILLSDKVDFRAKKITPLLFFPPSLVLTEIFCDSISSPLLGYQLYFFKNF